MWLADHWDVWPSVGFGSGPSCSAPQVLGATGAQEEGGGKLPSAAITVTLAWALWGEALVDTSRGGESWILVLHRNFVVLCLSLFFVWSVSVWFRHLVTLLREGFSFSEAHKVLLLPCLKQQEGSRVDVWICPISRQQVIYCLLIGSAVPVLQHFSVMLIWEPFSLLKRVQRLPCPSPASHTLLLPSGPSELIQAVTAEEPPVGGLTGVSVLPAALLKNSW